MLRLQRWAWTLLFLFALGLTFERRAFGYTDPGSALLLFQSMGAVASGVLFYFRRRLKRLFTRSQPKDTVSTPGMLPRADS